MKFLRSLESNEDTENINIFAKDFSRKLPAMDSESSHSSSKTSSPSFLGDENVNYFEGYSNNLATGSRQLYNENSKADSTSNLINRQKRCTSISEHVELPKKRWLREAVQDQQRWDSSQELARPINWDEVNIVEYENQRRPTVLMRIQDRGASKEVSRADIQTAIALVELKNGGPINYRQY